MKTMHESDYSNSENSRRRHNTSCLRSAGYTSQLQAEEIQQLKDEIARLKGQKPKPKIKPSNLEKQTEERETKK
ncbi:MAG: hypothetical protein U9N82_06915, partial [Thermodesulfobacteriota bacterium]|nr:hypothetical protein [Thermodesulfobacteriota bacterium]